MARRLIGTAVTDSNGEATITYTGTGAGKLNVVAESGTFVSPPYSIWDTVFHLECTTETSNWSYNDARITASFDSDGGHFTGLENTTFKQVSLTNNGARFLDGTKNHVIEFDIKKNYAVRIALLDNGANTRQILFLGGAYGSDWNHIKLVYNASTHKVTPYVNGTAQTEVDLSSYTMTTFGLNFLDDTSNQMDFYLKNIKIYYG